MTIRGKKHVLGQGLLWWLSGIFFLGYAPQLWAQNFTVAVRAYEGIQKAHRRWQPTLDYLNLSMPEHRFTLLPIVRLDHINQHAEQHTYDFILTNPSSFVELQERFNVRALATLSKQRADTALAEFGSVIFTHARNEDIITLNDLQGKTLMAVSEPSFGGWRVAWLEMLEQGMDPHRDLKSLLFTESSTQYEVVLSVLHEKVDAGVVRTDMLEKMEDEGRIDMRNLRVLNNKNLKRFPYFLSTRLYPEWAFACMDTVPDELAAQVKHLLLTIPASSKAAQRGYYASWVQPADYESIRRLLIKLRIPPFTEALLGGKHKRVLMQ